MCKASGQLSHWEKIIIRRLNVKLWHFALLFKSECSLCVGNAIRPLWVQTSLGQNVTLEVQTGLNVTRMFRGCTFHRGIYPYCRLIPQYVGIYMYLYMSFIYFSKVIYLKKLKMLFWNILYIYVHMYITISELRMSVVFIFLITFSKLNSGLIRSILTYTFRFKNYEFPMVKNKNKKLH
jgi:hypothetical protein